MSECGTYAGYMTHRRHGETACTECKAANAAYVAERRKSPDSDHLRRNAARTRALNALARQHPDEFNAHYVAALMGHPNSRSPVVEGSG